MSGSILAISCFTLISYLEVDAFFWIVILFIVWFVVGFIDTVATASCSGDYPQINFNKFLSKFGVFFQKINKIFFLSLLILFLIKTSESNNQYWSRYYKISLSFGQINFNQNSFYKIVMLLVNKSGHQEFRSTNNLGWIYKTPYLDKNKKYHNALIIGAGGGNDLALALENNVKKIDAIEIDPKIAELGKEYHPLKPYDNPKVNLIINDGRNFINNTNNKYDLIIFALTDSLTLASSYANTRLESYLFTVESFAKVNKLLNDNAVLVFYNHYREKWLIDKISAMISLVANKPVIRIIDQKNNVASIILCNDQLFYKKLISENYTKLDKEIKLEIFDYQKNTNNFYNNALATDDWPFLYLKHQIIPEIYLKNSLIIILLILVIFVFLARRQFKIKDFSLSMFFLGFSFMLLETKNIINFQLIFGSTWLVNSGVFLAILLFALTSAIISKFYIFKNKKILYFLMLLSLVMIYLFPITKVNNYSMLTKYIISSIITFLPIFIANLIFANFFKNQQNARLAFGSNILGAMMGGIFEYTAMISGYHFLILIIIVSYILAFIFAKKNFTG